MQIYVAELIINDGAYGAVVLDYKLFSSRAAAENFIAAQGDNSGEWVIRGKEICE